MDRKTNSSSVALNMMDPITRSFDMTETAATRRSINKNTNDNKATMASARVKTIKSQRLYMDSRDLVTHVNNNPNAYTFNLVDAIPNVFRIRLIDYQVPYSPNIIIYRYSDAEPDATHLALERAARLYQLGRPMPIYVRNEGWKLHVLEIFVSVSEDRNVAHMVCSGSYPEMYAPDGSGEIPGLIGSNYTELVIEWQNEPQFLDRLDDLRIQVKPVDAVLNLEMVQGIDWMVSDRPVVTEVLEGNIMRINDVIRLRDDDSTNAIITPFVYDPDYAIDVEKNTIELPNDKVRRPALRRTAFHVFRSPSMVQTTLMPQYSPDIEFRFKPVPLRAINIMWTVRTGSDHVFPLDGIYFSMLVFNEQGDGAARVFKHHVLVFDVFYYDD